MSCRLLYLVGQLGPGGSERQLYLLLKKMDRDRYRPEIVVWRFRPDDVYVPLVRELEVVLHFFPDSFTRLAKVLAFRRLVHKMRPEVMHSYSFYTNFAAWWAARGTSVISIGSCRGDFEYERTGSGPIFGRLNGRWPHHQIYNSYATAEAAVRLGSFFLPKHIRIVRNGVDLHSFRDSPVPSAKRTIILGVGSLLQIKRWDRTLVLAKELKNSGFDFMIRIAGTGPLRESLERQSRDYGLSHHVEFIGHSENIPALLRTANFLVHTSDAEACPNAIIEAMACGRAVVATDTGDIPSIVEDERTGFVVRRGDDEQLLDRVLRLMIDRRLCGRMGEAARSKAVREFGIERLLEETLAVYRGAGWNQSMADLAS